MAFAMEVDQWPLLDGQLSIHNYASHSIWYDPDAASHSSIDDHVTIQSQTAENWSYSDEMEAVMNLKGYTSVQSDAGMCSIPAEQQVNDFLPTAFEEGCLSDWQLQRILPLLQATSGPHSVGGAAVEMQAISLQSSAQKHNFILLPFEEPVLSEIRSQGLTSSNVSINVSNEDGNVIDLLTQLCDTVDGDMIIDQAQLAASYPSLPLMSPEDIDSLLSSGSWSTNSHVSALDSPFSIVMQPPNSPISDSESVSSSDMSVFMPTVEKKQRKKDQNKTAALRYRQKKRSEQGSVMTECDDLEKRNMELKTKVSEMMKEITYLKGLIDEIDA